MDDFWLLLVVIYLLVIIPYTFTFTSDEQGVATTPVTVVADAY